VNYERLPPPILAEATELLEATVAAFQTGIGEVRTAATVLGLLAIAQAWIADQRIAAGGSDALMTPLILRWHRTFVRRGVGRFASGRTAR
jgi:hypothetical protein